MTQVFPEEDAQRVSEWLDGETSETARDAVEQRLQTDPEAARIADAYRRIDEAFRDHVGAPRESASLRAKIDAAFARRARRSRNRRILRAALPIAASLAIVIGGGLWFEQRIVTRLAETQARTGELIAGAVQQALEASRSGESTAVGGRTAPVSGSITPIRTYRSKSGHWCREFEERLRLGQTDLVRTAIACRTPTGEWRRMETKTHGDAPLLFDIRRQSF